MHKYSAKLICCTFKGLCMHAFVVAVFSLVDVSSCMRECGAACKWL